MKTKSSKKKPYWEMNGEELAAATKEYDTSMIIDQARPLNAKERAIWDRMKRKPGRPKTGRGVRVISVSVEKELLSQSDALAKRMKLTRANLIARGLKAVLAVEGIQS